MIRAIANEKASGDFPVPERGAFTSFPDGK